MDVLMIKKGDLCYDKEQRDRKYDEIIPVLL